MGDGGRVNASRLRGPECIVLRSNGVWCKMERLSTGLEVRNALRKSRLK